MNNIVKIQRETLIFFVTLCCAAALFLMDASVCKADTPPSGSYQRSCNTINNDGTTLTAHCRKISGSWNNNAQLSITKCDQCTDNGGDISNCDGNIECTGVNLPNVGSYRNSCWCCRMDGATLRCHCNKRGSGSRWTSLNNAAGFDDIWNDDGNLKGKNNPPPGSYQNSCNSILYNKSADRITSASCKRKNGTWNNSAQHFNCQQCIDAGGDIANCDGNIDCTGVNLPNVGSYRNSCWCCRMNGTTLSCHCNKPGGGSNWTSLSGANNCPNIWNDRGNLKCN